jgi:hypothetical protein
MVHSSDIRFIGGFGTVFDCQAARDLLNNNGLGDIESVFANGAAARHRHAGRNVWDTQLVAADGELVHVYIKMNWGRMRFWPRMTDLKTGQWLQSMPVREWKGIGQLEVLGLNVPQRLAVFHSGMLSFRAAVVVRAIPPRASVRMMLANGDWQRLAWVQRKHILDRMVEVMRTIHAAGLGWRGSSLGHFYPQLDADNSDQAIWLIDCEGVHRRATQRTFDRDFRKLSRSFEIVGADRSTLNMLKRSIGRSKAESEKSKAA